MFASHEGHINVVRFLLQKGANNNWQANVRYNNIGITTNSVHVLHKLAYIL